MSRRRSPGLFPSQRHGHCREKAPAKYSSKSMDALGLCRMKPRGRKICASRVFFRHSHGEGHRVERSSVVWALPPPTYPAGRRRVAWPCNAGSCPEWPTAADECLAAGGLICQTWKRAASVEQSLGTKRQGLTRLRPCSQMGVSEPTSHRSTSFTGILRARRLLSASMDSHPVKASPPAGWLCTLPCSQRYTNDFWRAIFPFFFPARRLVAGILERARR